MPRSNRGIIVRINNDESNDSVKDIVVKVVGPYNCKNVSTVEVPAGFTAIVRFGGDNSHEVSITSDCTRNIKDIAKEYFRNEYRNLLRQDCRVTYVKSDSVILPWGTENAIGTVDVAISEYFYIGANGKAEIKIDTPKRAISELLGPSNKLTIVGATGTLKEVLKATISQELAKLLKSKNGNTTYIQADYDTLKDNIWNAAMNDTKYTESPFVRSGFELKNIKVTGIGPVNPIDPALISFQKSYNEMLKNRNHQ